MNQSFKRYARDKHRGEVPEERKIHSLAEGRKLALTHNLGGYPGEMVSFISLLGAELD